MHLDQGVMMIAAALALSGAALAQPGGLRVSTTTVAASQLPQPRLLPGERGQTCAGNARGAHRSPPFRFVSEEVAASLPPIARVTLSAWGDMHFKFPSDSCVDTEHLVRKFQEALGHEVTGVLSAADAKRINEVLNAARGELKQADTGAEKVRALTVADFLPSGGTAGMQFPPAPGPAIERCDARWRQIRMQRGQGSWGTPPKAVASQWTEYWRARPDLTTWAQQSGCASDLQLMVEHWQAAIGAPVVDARDTQAIAKTEALLEQARVALAQDSQQRQQAASGEAKAAAQASGETARARKWALDGLSGRTRLQDIVESIPQALCSVSGSTVSCRGRVAQCAAEAGAAQQAGATARGASTRQLQELTLLRQSQAEVALARCEAGKAYSAATLSSVTFAGQSITSAELSFVEGKLAQLSFNLEGPETARILLTRRYGRPQQQHETRVRDEVVTTGGGTAYAPGVGTVLVAPQQAVVPVSYSVTRYLWNAADVQAQESSGSFVMRFLN